MTNKRKKKGNPSDYQFKKINIKTAIKYHWTLTKIANTKKTY